MKQLLPMLLMLIFTSQLFSQKTKVEESSEKIADGKNNALVVWIREADSKEVEKEWISLMKKNKAKVSNKKEIFADNAILPMISANTVDVYAYAEQKDADVKFVVAFDLGGAFLNSKEHSAQYRTAASMVYDFAVDISKLTVQNLISAEQKNLSDMEKTKKNLEGDNDKMAKEIENYKKKIEENENKIKENENEIINVDNQIKGQQGVLEELEKKFKAID
jgi:hypothetical protein